jgi:hypothetical protein
MNLEMSIKWPDGHYHNTYLGENGPNFLNQI